MRVVARIYAVLRYEIGELHLGERAGVGGGSFYLRLEMLLFCRNAVSYYRGTWLDCVSWLMMP